MVQKCNNVLWHQIWVTTGHNNNEAFAYDMSNNIRLIRKPRLQASRLRTFTRFSGSASSRAANWEGDRFTSGTCYRISAGLSKLHCSYQRAPCPWSLMYLMSWRVVITDSIEWSIKNKYLSCTPASTSIIFLRMILPSVELPTQYKMEIWEVQLPNVESMNCLCANLEHDIQSRSLMRRWYTPLWSWRDSVVTGQLKPATEFAAQYRWKSL